MRSLEDGSAFFVSGESLVLMPIPPILADGEGLGRYDRLLGRWCQASVVGQSLRPATSVRCEGAKAVSRIRQSSKAGQPDTSGAMRDLLAAEPLRKSQIKGNEVWETVSGRARHRLPSCYPPNPGEDNRPGGGVPERASVPRIRALLPLDFVLGESKVENPSIN